ncbi:MAG: spermidine synthase [Proteobacteria bacterium]|nr:MAG: spermidine synthase [Pseudomonadota bacterium]
MSNKCPRLKGGAYEPATPRARRTALVGLAAWVLALFAVPLADAQANGRQLLHAERSLYREVLVYETDGVRCMCFTRNCRTGRQTCMEMRRPERIVMNYPRMMLGALYVHPEPRRILIVGLGGGTLPRVLEQLLPEARIDVVEIDPAVIRVAKSHFGFAESERVRVAAMDGRVFVKRAQRDGRRYDMVMLDAFDHEYIPEHLLTRDFLAEVRAVMTPDGVLVANTFSSSRLYDHESVTYAAVFDRFFNLKRENRVIIAPLGTLPSRAELAQASERFAAAFRTYGIDARELLRLFSTRRDWDERARVLTDQYSPANLLNRR